jgi:membrane protein DedA with SNARE-associated domain
MMIESTVLPMPSELVIPPAAYLAASGELSIAGVILAGTFGALTGATINYMLGYTLGRRIIYALADTKWAHLIFVTREKIEKAEKFFLNNGKTGTLIGRLVPGVRHLISIPAGMAKMPFGAFALWTFIGAGLWNIVLALLGYFFYSQKDLLEKYYKELIWVVIALGVVFMVYLVWKSWRRKKSVTRDS